LPPSSPIQSKSGVPTRYFGSLQPHWKAAAIGGWFLKNTCWEKTSFCTFGCRGGRTAKHASNHQFYMVFRRILFVNSRLTQLWNRTYWYNLVFLYVIKIQIDKPTGTIPYAFRKRWFDKKKIGINRCNRVMLYFRKSFLFTQFGKD
jgi:hypothetical protein